MLKQYWTYSFRGAIQKDSGKYLEPRVIEVDETKITRYEKIMNSYLRDFGWVAIYETEEECRNAAKIHINQHLKYLEEKKMLILKYEMKLFERLGKI